jgi:ABC-type antimicrobial peptide transport system permease subunit
LITVGIVVGLASSVAVTRYLAGLLFGVSPFDVPTFIVTSGLLAAAVTIASYFPARRAARVDPMVALRCE